MSIPADSTVRDHAGQSAGEHATLRLVRPQHQDIIPLDRRTERRKTVGGRVTAIRGTAEHPDDRTRICPLQLLNMSDAGLAAISQEPVELDVSMTVFIPPHGPEPGFDLFGRVVRCRSRDGDHGYEIAVALDHAGRRTRNAG